MDAKRPHVPRDTRLLFLIVLIAVATLWVLARIRFPDRVPTPNPMPPVLAQLAPKSAFEDIAASVAQIEPVLRSSLMTIATRSRDATAWTAPARATVAALKFGDGVAVALMDERTGAFDVVDEDAVEVARDPASHLAVVRVPSGAVPAPTTWSPRQFESPRFLLAADTSAAGISFRPVFVGSLFPIDSPVWSGPVWALPASSDLAPSTFVFNLDGAFAGLVVPRGDGIAMVPGEMVVALAERLVRETPVRPGQLGVEVQPITPGLEAAIGTSVGVIVTWVDPQGPAAGQIRATDLIEAVGGQAVATFEHWQAALGKIAEGDTWVLSVRQGDGVRSVQLVAAAMSPAGAGDPSLGLTLRTIRSVGAMVVRVDRGSAAFRSGLSAGDVITVFGDVDAPTAAQVSRAFASALDAELLLMGITRGDAHHVVTVERRR